MSEKFINHESTVRKDNLDKKIYGIIGDQYKECLSIRTDEGPFYVLHVPNKQQRYDSYCKEVEATICPENQDFVIFSYKKGRYTHSVKCRYWKVNKCDYIASMINISDNVSGERRNTWITKKE